MWSCLSRSGVVRVSDLGEGISLVARPATLRALHPSGMASIHTESSSSYSGTGGLGVLKNKLLIFKSLAKG